MRYSFNTFNHTVWLGLAPSLPAQIDAAAAAGYDHVGLDIASIRAHAAEGLAPEALADQMGAVGVTPYELAFLAVLPDANETRAGLAEALELVKVLHPVYVQAVVMGSPEECVGSLRDAAVAIADSGAGLAIEYIPNIPVRSIAQVLDLIDRVGLMGSVGDDDPTVGVCVDSFHFFHGPDTWNDLDALPLDRLAFVQFDDALAIYDPSDPAFGEAMVNGRAMPGEGVLELDEFARRFRSRGFDGVVSVEVLSTEWRARPLDDFVRASLATTQAGWRTEGGTDG